jgi:hypothetical protein
MGFSGDLMGFGSHLKVAGDGPVCPINDLEPRILAEGGSPLSP